jgi:hypothetical protein
MDRKFELAEVIDFDTVDTIRFDRLEDAQREPWGNADPIKYRFISELEVPFNPRWEPLVLNVWFQKTPEDGWKLLTED